MSKYLIPENPYIHWVVQDIDCNLNLVNATHHLRLGDNLSVQFKKESSINLVGFNLGAVYLDVTVSELVKHGVHFSNHESTQLIVRLNDTDYKSISSNPINGSISDTTIESYTDRLQVSLGFDDFFDDLDDVRYADIFALEDNITEALGSLECFDLGLLKSKLDGRKYLIEIVEYVAENKISDTNKIQSLLRSHGYDRKANLKAALLLLDKRGISYV